MITWLFFLILVLQQVCLDIHLVKNHADEEIAPVGILL